MKPLQIGIAGAGIGGLAAAIALARTGHEVVVYEQARAFMRVGADINLTPNAVRAIDGLGIGPAVRVTAARPTYRISRTWDSGEETSRMPMSDAAEQRYGAPQLTIHRADLLAALAGAVPGASVRFAKKVAALAQDDGGVRLGFADGSEERIDALIGADGIHSAVRTAMFGAEKPRFTGVVAFRSVIPAERMADVPDLQAFTKWWGPNPQSQIVTFQLNRGRDIFVFATIGQDSWTEESWTTEGSVAEMRDLYAGYHPHARALLEACDSVMKTALYERDPLLAWVQGRVALLGDACHPMLPFMAQGAGMAVEDAVVLGRCLEGVGGTDAVHAALKRYESLRLERTSRIQIGSRGNQWLKTGGANDADWVYGYDAWSA